MQIDAWAVDIATAKVLGRAVVAALHARRTGQFLGVFHETSREGREGGSDEAARPHRVSLDFIIHWRTT